MAGLSHPPGADDQIGGPAVVTERFKDGILGQRQGLVGTSADAVVVGVLALEADAAVGEWAHHRSVAVRPDVHAVGAELDAFAALLAGRGPVDSELADLVSITGRSGLHLA